MFETLVDLFSIVGISAVVALVTQLVKPWVLFRFPNEADGSSNKYFGAIMNLITVAIAMIVGPTLAYFTNMPIQDGVALGFSVASVSVFGYEAAKNIGKIGS